MRNPDFRVGYCTDMNCKDCTIERDDWDCLRERIENGFTADYSPSELAAALYHEVECNEEIIDRLKAKIQIKNAELKYLRENQQRHPTCETCKCSLWCDFKDLEEVDYCSAHTDLKGGE